MRRYDPNDVSYWLLLVGSTLIILGLFLGCSRGGGGGGGEPWPTYTTERVARVADKTVVRVDPRCAWRPDESLDRGVCHLVDLAGAIRE